MFKKTKTIIHALILATGLSASTLALANSMLTITPTEFTKRWNSVVNHTELNQLPSPSLKQDKNGKQYFVSKVASEVAVLGNVATNGYIDSATISAQPIKQNLTAQTSVLFVADSLLLTQIFVQNDEQSKKIIDSLIKTNPQLETRSIDYNGMRFSVFKLDANSTFNYNIEKI